MRTARIKLQRHTLLSAIVLDDNASVVFGLDSIAMPPPSVALLFCSTGTSIGCNTEQQEAATQNVDR